MASRLRSLLSALGKLGTVALILVAFAFGLAATVYLSLRSPEVQVPDLSGKTYNEGESTLESVGLSVRERARRYKSGTNPGVILDQSPRAGEVVKKGQTIAVVVSRAPKEGEAVESAEVQEEQKPSDGGEKQGGESNENENGNRERRRPRNANANRNANNSNNSNASGNLNANRNANANNRNANNRNANNRNANSGANRNRNTNGAPARNSNQPRANANRRPQ
ncbi:MAG TPA: PASTA domain-containing protein [Pyrinomonadaceae bacterium]|nr:PASTA domain-containing protein [Pyrinomonadaceae bacterium]